MFGVVRVEGNSSGGSRAVGRCGDGVVMVILCNLRKRVVGLVIVGFGTRLLLLCFFRNFCRGLFCL